MNEELISQIVRRILSEPAFQSLMPGDVLRNTAVKPAGLVLLNFVPDIERVLKMVEFRWGAECTLNILPSESVFKVNPELPAGMNWISAQDVFAREDWQRIIIPACSLNTLAKASLGLRDNPICEMIGRGISQGLPIELVTEHLGLTPQTPPAYRALYAGYLQKVQSYGVMVYETLGDKRPLLQDQGPDKGVFAVGGLITTKETVPAVEGPTVDKQKTASSEQSPAQDVIIYEKKFLGDKDAYGFPEESTVLVKRLTVISPLARDTLRIRRIELRQEMEGSL